MLSRIVLSYMVDDDRQVLQVLKRKIKKGEELLITYGWGYNLSGE